MKTIIIKIEDNEDITQALEEVKRQIQAGNTTGIYPTYDIIKTENN